MKKLTIYVELYEDIPVSDFEQLLLETGIEDIDCSYEIVEDSYEESYKREAYVREDRFDNTFKVGDEVYIDKGSSLPRIFGKVIDIDGDAITISDGKFTYHPNISKVHLLKSFDDDWTVTETSQFYDGERHTLRKYTRELNGHKVLVYPKYNEKLDQIDWTVFLDGEKKEVFETSYDAIDFVDYEATDLYL